MPDPTSDTRFEQAREHFLSGLACHQAADFVQAEQHYQASLRLVPGRASTLINLAATQLQCGRPPDALASADAALAVEPDSTDALLHRATALADLGQVPQALAAFERLLAIDPAYGPAWSGLGGLLRETHRLDEAAHAFRQALQHGADPALHGFYLAAVAAAGPAEVPPTAPGGYVRGLFDRYADDFDRHLVGQLHYQAHQRLVDGLPAGGPYRSALDLGCGTGLCGPLLRPRAERLTGVDLSPRMLDKARDTGAYDRLEQADLADFLRHDDAVHDLVVSADVFIYVGDLQPVFEGVSRRMSGGVFCFTVECEAGDGHTGYRLLPSLRYAHSRPYLQRLAAQHGFDVIAMRDGPVREEQRRPIDGLYVYLRRMAGA